MFYSSLLQQFLVFSFKTGNCGRLAAPLGQTTILISIRGSMHLSVAVSLQWEQDRALRFPAVSVLQKLACLLTFMHMTVVLKTLICKEIENTQKSGLGRKQSGIQHVKVGKMLYFW